MDGPCERGGERPTPKVPSTGAPYSRIAIVSLGLIGGSLALALRRSGYRGRIFGVSGPETVREALELGAIDEGHTYEAMGAATSRSELVVLAGPISAIIEHIRTLGRSREALSPGAVISDVGSTKRAILQAAAESLPENVRFVGGHPLAGSEQRGIRAADPFLFQNAYYVLTPSAGVPSEEADRLGSFLGTLGARVIFLPAEVHDRIAAAISHLPQLLAVSLVRFLDGLGACREAAVHLAAGGFRDMTRIASSPYAVWRDILDTNREVIEDVFHRFLGEARSVVEGLGDGSIAGVFEGAARTRAEIPRDTKGFIRRLWDVLVVVEDRPGTIASIAVPLAARGININDIEVLKVREGEGGTLRLGFASEKDAREAMRVLAEIGYGARLRE
jgi:prephenate dehydrogenase